MKARLNRRRDGACRSRDLRPFTVEFEDIQALKSQSNSVGRGTVSMTRSDITAFGGSPLARLEGFVCDDSESNIFRDLDPVVLNLTPLKKKRKKGKKGKKGEGNTTGDTEEMNQTAGDGEAEEENEEDEEDEEEAEKLYPFYRLIGHHRASKAPIARNMLGRIAKDVHEFRSSEGLTAGGDAGGDTDVGGGENKAGGGDLGEMLGAEGKKKKKKKKKKKNASSARRFIHCTCEELGKYATDPWAEQHHINFAVNKLDKLLEECDSIQLRDRSAIDVTRHVIDALVQAVPFTAEERRDDVDVNDDDGDGDDGHNDGDAETKTGAVASSTVSGTASGTANGGTASGGTASGGTACSTASRGEESSRAIKKYRYLLRRFSRSRALPSLTWISGLVLSGMSHDQLGRVNPYLTEGDRTDVLHCVVSLLLRANRVCHISRVIGHARELKRMLKQLLRDSGDGGDGGRGGVGVGGVGAGARGGKASTSVTAQAKQMQLISASLAAEIEGRRHYFHNDEQQRQQQQQQEQEHKGQETKGQENKTQETGGNDTHGSMRVASIRRRLHSTDEDDMPETSMALYGSLSEEVSFTFDPRFLLFEYMFDLLLRKRQVQVRHPFTMVLIVVRMELLWE
jgi:hypothetical protein